MHNFQKSKTKNMRNFQNWRIRRKKKIKSRWNQAFESPFHPSFIQKYVQYVPLREICKKMMRNHPILLNLKVLGLDLNANFHTKKSSPNDYFITSVFKNSYESPPRLIILICWSDIASINNQRRRKNCINDGHVIRNIIVIEVI